MDVRKLVYKLVHYTHHIVGFPVATLCLLTSSRIHPAYELTVFGKLRLGARMLLNNLRVQSGTVYKLHLAMALAILETPPDVEGDVVECGSWKGGSAVNLSLVCRIVKRKLVIHDSFQGLPAAPPGDRQGTTGYAQGDYKGTLEEVRRNLERYGAIEQCEFLPGWFRDTLPSQNRPVILAFLDVDLEDSLDTCVRHLWPRLVPAGYLFTDEALELDYMSLFFSERWWREHFDRTPPGLVGAGTGLALGTYYVGPLDERYARFLQHPGAGAFTRPSMSCFWSYYPQR